MMRLRSLAAAVCLAGIFAVGLSGSARACPFCDAVSLTFAQEIAQSDVAAIAKLVEAPPAAALGPGAEGPLPKGKFEVVETIKGGDLAAAAGHTGDGAQPIEAIVLEDKPLGTLFLLMAIKLDGSKAFLDEPTSLFSSLFTLVAQAPERLLWSSPIRLSDRGVPYIKTLSSLPEKGPDRLAFFMKHLEDEDEALARDSYDEFAVAPYDDLKGLAPRMDSKQLLAWIESPKVQANRRRLYATMLGVCGTKEDAARIADIIAGKGAAAEHAEVRGGLDAMIACYVALEGAKALDLVDELFLKRTGNDKDIPFTETYAAVQALRFLGEESNLVPRARVLESLRYLLDEPKLADLVIADLARWQDWSVIERLVTIFKDAKQENIFVREPIVNYLRACPLPEAAAAVTELEKIDPEAVRRASALAGLAGLMTAAPAEVAPALPATDNSTLVAAIEVVQGDEDPTSERAADAQAQKPSQSERKPDRTVQWMIWGVIVVAVAIFSRVTLRPASAPR